MKAVRPIFADSKIQRGERLKDWEEPKYSKQSVRINTVDASTLLPPTPFCSNQKHLPTPSSFHFYKVSFFSLIFVFCCCHFLSRYIWFGLDLYLVLWACHFMPCCILRWTLERLCRRLDRAVGGWHDWQIPPFPSFSSRGIEDVGQEGEKGKYMDSEGKRTLGRKRQGRGKKGEQTEVSKKFWAKWRKIRWKEQLKTRTLTPSLESGSVSTKCP